MKRILFVMVICSLAVSAFGKGDSIPKSKLRGLTKGQLSYQATGWNQWTEKIPKCQIKYKRFEVCPRCEGSGQLAYHIRGNYAGIYDCMKCGPGTSHNPPDGLIVARGEDYSDCYFPAKTIADLEIDMGEHNNVIDGDIDLVSEDGKTFSCGFLKIVVGFQYGQSENYVKSISFNWTYRGQDGKDHKFLNYSSTGTIFTLFNDNQISLEFHIVEYTPAALKIKLIQKQKEMFTGNKKTEKED